MIGRRFSLGRVVSRMKLVMVPSHFSATIVATVCTKYASMSRFVGSRRGTCAESQPRQLSLAERSSRAIVSELFGQWWASGTRGSKVCVLGAQESKQSCAFSDMLLSFARNCLSTCSVLSRRSAHVDIQYSRWGEEVISPMIFSPNLFSKTSVNSDFEYLSKRLVQATSTLDILTPLQNKSNFKPEKVFFESYWGLICASVKNNAHE